MASHDPWLEWVPAVRSQIPRSRATADGIDRSVTLLKATPLRTHRATNDALFCRRQRRPAIRKFVGTFA
ncbi:hypothetical protein ARTHRO9V_10120 [Arthrobacter sp. 9V]|nr:hypothetical protein ARTHRO9V_10120 [Arthrobacter sp. 9V]